MGVLLYVQTVAYDYALDDKIVITHNTFTQRGVAGIPKLLSTDFLVGFLGEGKALVAGSRYRPLSLITFALEWQLLGRAPWLSHLVNALLYGLTGIVLCLVLARLFPPGAGAHRFWNIPVLATLLFLVHPLHTEVVANIKGRDEILSLLGALGALVLTLRVYRGGTPRHAVLAGGLFLLGLLGKETAVSFLAIIPLAVWCFGPAGVARSLRASAAVFIAAGVYLALRFWAVGATGSAAPPPELMNDPFLGATLAQRLATVTYTTGLYLKLLVVPHPLTHDYYPYHIPIVGWSDPRPLIALAVILALAVWTLLHLPRRHPLAFCAVFFAATFLPVSNLLVGVGTFMNERFLYAPSVAFALAVAYLVVTGAERVRRPAFLRPAARAALVAVIGLFALGTVVRNPAWRNDDTLALTDVATSSGSAKANMAAGLALVNEAQAATAPAQRRPLLDRATGYLRRSLAIYPGYLQSMDVLGTAYFLGGESDSSLAAYTRCLDAGGAEVKSVQCARNLEALGDDLAARGQPEAAARCYRTLLAHVETAPLRQKLGRLEGRDLKRPADAVRDLERASALDPGNASILRDLGTAYGVSGDPERAVAVFQQALALDPGNAETLGNLAAAYAQLGDAKQAAAYRARAEAASRNRSGGTTP